MPWENLEATHLNIIISLLILSVGAWTLWLSHYKNHRSEVELRALESASKPGGFGGGSNAFDDSAFWTGRDYLRLSNIGKRGAYITSVDHELVEFRKEDETTLENPPAELSKRKRRLQQEIDPNWNTGYIPRFQIEPDEHIGPMVEYDTAIVRHTLVVEDNKGPYEVTYDSEMTLTAPGDVAERWEEERENLE